jgi:hypothetical protein
MLAAAKGQTESVELLLARNAAVGIRSTSDAMGRASMTSHRSADY